LSRRVVYWFSSNSALIPKSCACTTTTFTNVYTHKKRRTAAALVRVGAVVEKEGGTYCALGRLKSRSSSFLHIESERGTWSHWVPTNPNPSVTPTVSNTSQ
jgi:hypothetical protein